MSLNAYSSTYNPYEEVRSGIAACEEGLATTQRGVCQATNSFYNTCSGIRRINNGICECSRALDTIEQGLSDANALNRSTNRYLCQCRQGLNRIAAGRQAICYGNPYNGATNAEAGVNICQRGLDNIADTIDSRTS